MGKVAVKLVLLSSEVSTSCRQDLCGYAMGTELRQETYEPGSTSRAKKVYEVDERSSGK